MRRIHRGRSLNALVGILLLVPAITVIGLLLWAPVRLAYTRPDAEASDPDAG